MATVKTDVVIVNPVEVMLRAGDLSLQEYLELSDSMMRAARSLRREDHAADCPVYLTAADNCTWPISICLPSDYVPPVAIKLLPCAQECEEDDDE